MIESNVWDSEFCFLFVRQVIRTARLKAVVNEYAGKEDITISKEMNSNTHLIKSDSSKVIKTRDLL